MSTCDDKSVISLWEDFKRALQSGIEQYVPQRSISKEASPPWITQDIKRAMHKRDSLYDKYKKHRRPTDRQAHIEFKHLVNQNLSYIHVGDTLGITNPIYLSDSNANFHTVSDSNTNALATKNPYSLLKNSKMDSKGSPLLKHDGQLHTNTTDKANILNQQVNSHAW